MRPTAVAALLLAVLAGTARAGEPAKYRFRPGGRVSAVRAADVNGDGRLDLVLLLSRERDGGGTAQELVLLPTPEQAARGTFFRPGSEVRIAVDEPPFASAGAVALGRFGPAGAFRLRFLARDGIRETDAAGLVVATHDVPTLLGRSAGRDLVFWDQVADLDGDGRDELWFPLGEGAGVLHVLAGDPAASRTLSLEASNRGVTDYEHLIRRHAYVPTLEPVDLDGDGRRELAAYRDGRLVAWPFAATRPDGPVPPSFDLLLPFVKKDVHPDEVHTPRLQLLDVDGDGRTDLLVTLVTGNRRQIGSFRTQLLHFPGPFRDPATGGLVPPRVRIDTESVALHPLFVDLDGDGARDYVCDSIRGSRLDLIKRVLGQDPTIWHVGFLFDRKAGTFETVPSFSVERPYSREEAVGNRFGRTGFFEGDFDGDGFKDLLDLGALDGLEILRGARKEGPRVGDPLRFEEPIQPRIRVPSPLAAAAVVRDLTGDGRSDAVLWSEDTLYLLVPGGGP